MPKIILKQLRIFSHLIQHNKITPLDSIITNKWGENLIFPNLLIF